MEEKQELTGNDFIDAYNLGVEAGKKMQESAYKDSRGSWFEMYSQKNTAEKELAEAKADNAKLKEKVKKLKKKLKEARS